MKRILLSIFLLGAFCSCEDFIDLQPLDQVTMDDYWSWSIIRGSFIRLFVLNHRCWIWLSIVTI